VRRLDAAFFLSAFGNEKRKAAMNRRTPKKKESGVEPPHSKKRKEAIHRRFSFFLS